MGVDGQGRMRMWSRAQRISEGMRMHSPAEECDPAPLAAIVLLEVKVVHGPPTLLLGEVSEELGGS